MGKPNIEVGDLVQIDKRYDRFDGAYTRVVGMGAGHWSNHRYLEIDNGAEDPWHVNYLRLVEGAALEEKAKRG